eukprot:scaffold23456_cov144-Cylindrotheca_fusiformis.AAC.1
MKALPRCERCRWPQFCGRNLQIDVWLIWIDRSDGFRYDFVEEGFVTAVRRRFLVVGEGVTGTDGFSSSENNDIDETVCNCRRVAIAILRRCRVIGILLFVNRGEQRRTVGFCKKARQDLLEESRKAAGIAILAIYDQ